LTSDGGLGGEKKEGEREEEIKVGWYDKGM